MLETTTKTAAILDDDLLPFAIEDVARRLQDSDDRGAILALIQHLAIRANDTETLNALADSIVELRRAEPPDNEWYKRPSREELLTGARDYLAMDRELKNAETDREVDQISKTFWESHPNW